MKLPNVEDIYLLSPMQQGMLFHSLYAPQSGVYFEQFVCTLRGELNAATFQRAWQRVVDRHTILRTSFLWEGLDEPLQVVSRQVTLPWAQADWRDLTPLEQYAQLESFLQADRAQGFVLSQAPLLRCFLAQTAADAHTFVMSNHHALMDGWSLSSLLREVFLFYETFGRGAEIEEPTPRPYRDYIAWLQKQDEGKAETFWRTTLRGFSAPTTIPVGSTRTGSSTVAPIDDVGPRALSAATTAALQTLARQYHLTINTVVQGAWALLLSRYSGETDVMFGATTAGRPVEMPGAAAMIGLFINTLPVRVQCDPLATVGAWLHKLQQQQLELRQYEYSPLMQIQGWSEIARGQPLFESILVFENHSSTPPAQIGSLTIGDVRGVEQTNYPLTLSAWLGPELTLHLAYDGQRFAAEAMQRMMGHLQVLLETIAHDATQHLADLPLLTSAEAQQIAAWNHNPAPVAAEARCIHHLFERQAAATPDAVAVVDFRFGILDLGLNDADQIENRKSKIKNSMTYRELNARANQLARYLQTLGVGPGTPVGLCLERSPAMIVGMMGILKAGGAYVPLDPTYPPERLAFIMEDTQLAVLVTQAQWAAQLPTQNVQVVCLDREQVVIATYSTENVVSAVTPESMAYLLYTSGSTGKPKGVIGSHRALTSYIETATDLYELTPQDRILQCATINFDTATEEIHACLTTGGTLVLRTEEMLHSVPTFLQKCAEWELTVLDLPTAFWHEVAHELTTTDLTLPASVRLVIIGGEQALPERVRAWRQKVGSYPRLLNSYGPTEATVAATVCELSSYANDACPAPIGHPLPNVEIYLLDSSLQPTPIGVPGEIYIGGPGLADGYYRRPALTAEKFVPHPFTAGQRLYKTGDLGRWLPAPEGAPNIEFIGRRDHQVKIRGFRVELGEIEALLHQHPAVREAVVVAHSEQNSSNNYLVAYVTPVQESLDTHELARYVRAKLPAYMAPATFVVLEKIPLLPNGKVDRHALPAPARDHLARQRDFVPPRDLIELQLASIWEKVLNVQPIGIKDNFFELGGHSLLTMQLMTAVEKQFGRDLPLSIVFQNGTIEQMAALIRQEAGFLPQSTLVALQAGGSKLPFFCVHPAGGSVLCYTDLARHLGPDRPFYGLQNPALLGNQPPFSSIEAMAAHYVAQVRSVQPHGPYLLGGWSLGGTIAFEMAQQFQREGQTVALLALLDTLAPSPAGEGIQFVSTMATTSAHWMRQGVDKLLGRPAAAPDEQTMALMLEEVGRALRKEIVIAPEALRDLSPDQILPYIVEQFNATGEVMPEEQLTAIFDHARRHADVNQAALAALQTYRPQPYAGQITLLRICEVSPAQLQFDRRYGDATFGWGALADRPVAVQMVPGEHRTMVYDPHAQPLAQHLGAWIDAASASAGSDDSINPSVELLATAPKLLENGHRSPAECGVQSDRTVRSNKQTMKTLSTVLRKRRFTMTQQQNMINWKAVLWSAALIFGIPALYNSIVLSGYGLYVGFQTRGDSELIQAGIQTLLGSLIFQATFYVVMVAVAFWRSRILMQQKSRQATTEIGIAVALAVMVQLASQFMF